MASAPRWSGWILEKPGMIMMMWKHMVPGRSNFTSVHDYVIKWKHFPHYWPLVQGIHRSPVNSLHKGQWGEALMFSLICAWINGWVNTREAGDLRRHSAHYDVTLMAFKLNLRNGILGTSCDISHRWVLQNPIDDESTLAQVVVWCRQATRYYLNQCWPRSISPYDVTP